MVSEPIPDTITRESQADSDRGRRRMLWLVSGVLLVGVGWLWPYAPAELPDRLNDTSWALGWLTALVLIGGAIGYILRSRWSIVLVPLGLYVGGVLHWLQFEWGFQWPFWEDFLWFSGAALAVLLLSAGLSAGVACRVIGVQSRPAGRGAGGIRLSAAFAALLGLLAISAMNVLPFPYVSGLLGFGAILCAIELIQETRPTPREHLLAIGGMVFGLAAVATQLYSLWTLVQDI